MRIINIDFTGYIQLDIDEVNIYDSTNDYEKVNVENEPIKDIIEKLNKGVYSMSVFEECYDKVLDGEETFEYSKKEED